MIQASSALHRNITAAAAVCLLSLACSGSGGTTNCDREATVLAEVVCVSNAFQDTLTPEQRAAVVLDWSDAVAKTSWSNFPPGGPSSAGPVGRPGLQFKDLSDTSYAAAKAIARAVLSAEGQSDAAGIWKADDSLQPLNRSFLSYSAELYNVAFIGAPSTASKWMLQIGGHHMAYNVTWVDGVGYPTPNHVGVEPKAEFTVDGQKLAPLADEGAAMSAIFASLDPKTLSAAYLKGQSFSDVLVGPIEYKTGKYATDSFPTGNNRRGVVVSSLAPDQQDLVLAAIKAWVNDFDPSIATPLLEAYTSSAAYADTLIAWGGTEKSGPNLDVTNTYFRIDGPRLWIELACPAGVVITDKNHYHSIYRDKLMDYGKNL